MAGLRKRTQKFAEGGPVETPEQVMARIAAKYGVSGNTPPAAKPDSVAPAPQPVQPPDKPDRSWGLAGDAVRGIERRRQQLNGYAEGGAVEDREDTPIAAAVRQDAASIPVGKPNIMGALRASGRNTPPSEPSLGLPNIANIVRADAAKPPVPREDIMAPLRTSGRNTPPSTPGIPWDAMGKVAESVRGPAPTAEAPGVTRYKQANAAPAPSGPIADGVQERTFAAMVPPKRIGDDQLGRGLGVPPGHNPPPTSPVSGEANRGNDAKAMAEQVVAASQQRMGNKDPYGNDLGQTQFLQGQVERQRSDNAYYDGLNQQSLARDMETVEANEGKRAAWERSVADSSILNRPQFFSTNARAMAAYADLYGAQQRGRQAADVRETALRKQDMDLRGLETQDRTRRSIAADTNQNRLDVAGLDASSRLQGIQQQGENQLAAVGLQNQGHLAYGKQLGENAKTLRATDPTAAAHNRYYNAQATALENDQALGVKLQTMYQKEAKDMRDSGMGEAEINAALGPKYFSMYQQLQQRQQRPTGYAEGGEVYAEDEAMEHRGVDVSGRQVIGAGTGKSDSLPAYIDGEHPAALSTDEFVMPVEAVRHFGLAKLNKMVAEARKSSQQR